MNDICHSISALQDRIHALANQCGRSGDTILLIGVTKTHPMETILEAAACGLVHFGENRVQELVPKMEAAPAGSIWHMIGTLQTNKIKYLVPRVDWIQSVHSAKALLEIEKRAGQAGRVIKVLIQVNISDEGQKSGCEPEEVASILQEAQSCAHLEVHGLMGIASFEADKEVIRPQFRLLRTLRDAHRHMETPHIQMKHLSMGMSHDMDVAIEEGATMVRVGSALFGNRS